MPNEDRLEELLLVWEERKECGEQPSAEELCQDFPELVGRLRESIGAIRQMQWLDDELSQNGSSPGGGFSQSSGSRKAAGALMSTDSNGPSGVGRSAAAPAVRVLGDYTVLERIAIGGMGEVFKAVHRRMQRVVALKILRQDAVASAESVERFHREVKTAAKLDHPNIVTAYDAGEDGGVHYLVMEFVDGHDLSRHVKEHGPLSAEQAARCVIQAAQGLAYAHQQGITHRDIKPANLLIDRNGTVKILDMGLARPQEAAGTDEARLPSDFSSTDTEVNVDLTRTGSVHGTVAFMAPEQREDAKRVDHRADIYGLGGTLYYLLTAKPPRGPEKGADNELPVEDRVAACLRKERPDLPADLVAVIRKTLARRPEDRPQSVGEVTEALRLVMDDESTVGRRRAWRLKLWSLWATVAAVVLLLVGWLAYQGQGFLRAVAIQQRLLESATEDVPPIISELEPYRRWADPRLKAALENAEASKDARAQLHASLALFPVDPTQLEYLDERLLSATADELPTIRDALREHREELAQRLWAVLETADEEPDRRFRAACALATYDPTRNRWAQVDDVVADRLVMQSAPAVTKWIDCLRPIGKELVAPLSDIFRVQDEQLAPQRLRSAQALAEFAADDPELLADLLMDADQERFAMLYPALESQRHRAVPPLEAELDEATPPEHVASEPLARRKANAGVALLRLGREEKVWALFEHGSDPTTRSLLIHSVSPSNVNPEILVARLEEEEDVSARRALILSLGEFQEGQLGRDERHRLIVRLSRLYEQDADPGIHGAAQWLLRRWGHGQRLKGIDQRLIAEGRQRQRQWYLNSEGQAMVVFPGPVQFVMGSPESEPDRQENELLRATRIDHTFALATQEVTVEQFQRFLDANPDVPDYDTRENRPPPECPKRFVASKTARAYCRWLSEKEGMPDEQMCYPPVLAVMQRAPVAEDYIKRTGYRLPTEAEWEYACRAGASTSRYYGYPDDLLDEYAWFRTHVHDMLVGRKKPNDFGLFDMLGSVQEFCHQSAEDPGIMLRGASYRRRAGELRCAHRLKRRDKVRPASLGFRVARTLALPSVESAGLGEAVSASISR
jgi:formylglycine-generating enzyme required for sulfatase activity/tRNA A-37 threonylcarbamoyl transferase component Bud32